MKKISIAQPYFIPYLAYIQLIYASDVFISYDNVNYIKNSWINRNIISIHDEYKFLTVPVLHQSSNCLISKTRVDWSKNIHDKFLKTLQMSYARSPYKNEMIEIMSHILSEPLDSIGELALKSIQVFCDYLSIKTDIKTSSSLNLTKKGEKTKDLLQIILSQKAQIYINPIGGLSLYKKSDFYDHGVILLFLQGTHSNSRLDVCMHNSRSAVQDSLFNHSFV